MTSRDFCYWLQGFFEIAAPEEMSALEVEQVKKHLNLVFIHEIDPSFGGPEKQKPLNEAHGGKPPSVDGVNPSSTLIRC